tara:strand:- start:523 stop:633 length:111 start_codon:yes stop_codon:yes gene_type:complete
MAGVRLSVASSSVLCAELPQISVIFFIPGSPFVGQQ